MEERGRKQFFSLQNEDVTITDNENLLAHATQYYKSLFSPGGGDAFELDENLWSNEEKVTELENQALTRLFEEEEIKYALFQMEKNKAAGPDEFPIEFF